MNNIWIRITFNSYNNLDDKDALISELRQVCPVQEGKRWYSHACTGLEFVVEFFINSPLSDFIKGIVLPGLAWDATKTALKKISSAFSTFLAKNEGFDLQHLQLTFDDVVIKVNGIDTYGFLLRLYQMLPHHLEVLSRIGITDVVKIELPFIEGDETDKYGNKEYYYPPLDTPEDEYLWKITYLLGCESCYYKPSTEKTV